MPSWGWQAHWKTIVDKLRVVASARDEQQLLVQLSTPGARLVLGFVNAHAMNLVTCDRAYHQALASADVLLRDGSGMAILLHRLGLAPGLNMNGTDFIPKLLAAFKGRRVAFWGTEEPFLGNAVRNSQARFGVEVVSAHHGFDDVDTYLDLARRQRPELIVLGMGMPKQEAVAACLADGGVPGVVVCGGAILDFLGGKVSRAPGWIRRLGCEWLFRLVREPKRLFGRYVVGNPLFLWRTLSYARGRGQ